MIRRAIVKQELPASKIGSIWRIRRGDLNAWMEKAKGGSSIPPRSELTELVGRYFGRR
jgi:hypothetical protein